MCCHTVSKDHIAVVHHVTPCILVDPLAASICLEGESSRFLREFGKDSGRLQLHNCKLEFIYIYTARIRKGYESLLLLHEVFVAPDFTY